MANLKEIRSRIISVNSTRQITSAMKMVSAAKLRRAQDAIVQMRPYATKLQEILQNLSASLDVSENAFGRSSEVKNVLIVAINSNRGLCGAFNNNVIKQARILIEEHKGANVKVLCIGKKAFDFFKKTNLVAGAGYPAEPYKIYDELTFDNSSIMAYAVMDKFLEGNLDKVYLIYNSFKNAAVQYTQVEQFLPILPPAVTESSTSVEYIFEPNKEEIVEDLIPRSLKVQFYKAILDSRASEHGARMTAMHKATDNATDLIKELKLTYNKARQASITNEILEIVAGAEALNG
jgi:F-type H+-transporting ATPase subunit gamma